MRILLAAKHPPGGRMPIGGVQSWCETVGGELRRRGHEVICWGPEWPMPAGGFDAGVFANLAHTKRATRLCGRVLRISHGIVKDEAGGPGFSATSEEVADRWGCDGPVIRQPIDLGFWRPGNAPRSLLVRHSYRAGLDYLPGLADGLQFVHLQQESAEAVRDVLQRAAVVIATGRAALEAMACGAPVVIADDRPYQGPLLDTDTPGAMRRNYSGRGGRIPTPTLVAGAMDAAMARGSLRDHVARNHDAEAVVDHILEALC